MEVATGSNSPNVQACILPGSHELQSTWGCSSFQEISHGRCRSGVEVAIGSKPYQNALCPRLKNSL